MNARKALLPNFYDHRSGRCLSHGNPRSSEVDRKGNRETEGKSGLNLSQCCPRLNSVGGYLKNTSDKKEAGSATILSHVQKPCLPLVSINSSDQVSATEKHSRCKSSFFQGEQRKLPLGPHSPLTNSARVSCLRGSRWRGCGRRGWRARC